VVNRKATPEEGPHAHVVMKTTCCHWVIRSKSEDLEAISLKAVCLRRCKQNVEQLFQFGKLSLPLETARMGLLERAAEGLKTDRHRSVAAGHAEAPEDEEGAEEAALQALQRPLLVVLNKKDLVRPRDLADKVKVGLCSSTAVWWAAVHLTTRVNPRQSETGSRSDHGGLNIHVSCFSWHTRVLISCREALN
jgi:hypothetical protein